MTIDWSFSGGALVFLAATTKNRSLVVALMVRGTWAGEEGERG